MEKNKTNVEKKQKKAKRRSFLGPILRWKVVYDRKDDVIISTHISGIKSAFALSLFGITGVFLAILLHSHNRPNHSGLISDFEALIIILCVSGINMIWRLLYIRKIFFKKNGSKINFTRGIYPFLKNKIFDVNNIRIYLDYAGKKKTRSSKKLVYLIFPEHTDSKIIIAKAASRESLLPIYEAFKNNLNCVAVDNTTTDKSKTKKRILHSVIVAISTVYVAIAIVFLIVFFQILPDTNQKIRTARTQLLLYRSTINKFCEDKGKYPDSVAELTEYMRIDLEIGFNSMSLKEHITNPDGVSSESSVLDGKGGWYYDKTKGELRFNITQPIKNYDKFYFGMGRNDIPCEW